MEAIRRREFIAMGVGGAVALATGRLDAATPGRPLVLVTADLEAHVAVVDALTGRIVRRIATADVPRSIEQAGRWAVVAHSEIGRVSLIDTASFRVRRVAGAFGEPRYAAAHPDGRHVILTDAAAGELVVVDLRRARVVSRIGVGSRARHLTLDRTGRRLWVALGSTASEIVTVNVADPLSPRRANRVRPPYLAHDVVFSPDGRHVWVTSGDRQTIGIYDAARRRLVRRIPALAPPQHVAFSERGLAAYVTSDDAIRVHRLDGRLLRTTSVPDGSYNVSRGGGVVFTPSLERGTLCLLDRNGRVRRTVRVAQSAHDACFVWGT